MCNQVYKTTLDSRLSIIHYFSIEYQRKSSPQFQRKSESASDTEGRTKKYELANKHSIRENIRMDIPFSSVEPPEQQDHSEKNKSM